MRDTQINEEEEHAVQVVWKHERAERTLCDASGEGVAVGGRDFAGRGRRSRGGEVWEEGCHFCSLGVIGGEEEERRMSWGWTRRP
jgi:hypothetical protein